MSQRLRKLVSNRESISGVAVVRLSDPSQDKIEGSRYQQEHRIRRDLERYGEELGVSFKLEKVFIVKKSGKEDSIHLRHDLKEICYLIEKGLVGFVIIEKIDRLSRAQDFNNYFIKLCDEHKVLLFSIDEGGFVDKMNRNQRIQIGIKNLLAQDYSEELSEKKLKKNREAMINSGKDTSSLPCLGLDIMSPCFYKINKKEVKQVILIFEKFISCRDFVETSRWANSNELKTKKRIQRQKEYSENGEELQLKTYGNQEFTPQTIKVLITNPKLRGINYFNDSYDQFPKLQDNESVVSWKYRHGRVIDKELTDKVDEILDKLKSSNGKKNRSCQNGLLSGIFIHSDGVPFHAVSEGGKKYYRHPIHKIRIRRDEFDARIFSRLKEYIDSVRKQHRLIA